jgi:hypothetical protein
MEEFLCFGVFNKKLLEGVEREPGESYAIRVGGILRLGGEFLLALVNVGEEIADGDIGEEVSCTSAACGGEVENLVFDVVTLSLSLAVVFP